MADYDSSLPVRTENNGDVASKIVDGTTPSQEMSVETDGSINTRLNDGSGNDVTSTAGKLDIALNDEAGDPYTSANPLPVSLEESPGDEVVFHDFGDSIAKDANANIDYTVTGGKTLLLDNIFVSGSGKMRVEVLIETAAASGVFPTFWVGFNSTSSPNVIIPSNRIGKVTAGAIIRVIITNLDNQAQNLYATIVGVEV